LTQHFLLSSYARSLSLKAIFREGEDAAYKTFCRLRWPENDGEPVCPRCGHYEAYSISSRRKFKCKECHHQFSVTSGTIFASRKLEFTDLLAANCLFVNAAKGLSALQLSRDLAVQYKTAFVLAHKIREALENETANLKLSGDVEIDGAHFCGYVRPANWKKNRKDRRRWCNKSPNRRVIVAFRQRGGRTRTFVTKTEPEGVDLVIKHLNPKTIIHADEGPWWDRLEGRHETYRVNHQECYSNDGINTNLVESFFARVRRMVKGQHHQVSPKYLHLYAAHASWVEDHRRERNGDLADLVIERTMRSPVSRNWKAYWQGAATRAF